MQGTDNSSVREMGLTFVRSQLASAQSLEVIVEHLIGAIVEFGQGGEICEILEDIANVYMNMSERIAEARASLALSAVGPECDSSDDPVTCLLSAPGLEVDLSHTGRTVGNSDQMSKV